MARATAIITLNRLSPSPTLKHLNTQIRESTNTSNLQKALHLFRQMKQNSISPNNFTFPFIAKACAQLINLTLTQMVHSHVIKSPFWGDVYVGAAVMDSYVKCRSLRSAYKVFDEMPVRDVAAWNVMLLGFLGSGCVGGFFQLFGRMRVEGVVMDSMGVMGLIQAVVLGDVRLVRAVHSIVIRLGMSGDVSVVNTEISAYTKCGDFGSAEDVFFGIDLGFRTVVSWNALLAGYALSGNNVETIECLVHGMLIHAQMIQLACDVDTRGVNTTIAMYSKCGLVDLARQLFDVMPCRTCVSWTVIIDGYGRRGNIDEAWDLLMGMEDVGEKPDDVTLISLISGCGQAGSLKLGRWLNHYALSNGFGDNIMVHNALIDMYAKCGCINEARQLFHSMPRKTEACTHAGFLEKGWECFSSMKNVYNISPTLEHYSSMVDLLGRKGRVQEALELIVTMKATPDAGIWGTLLNACKIHKNIEIGEYAAHRLFELEPETAASYVEMANMYASEARWDDVSTVRAMMKGKGVWKSPGQSFVEIRRSLSALTGGETNAKDPVRALKMTTRQTLVEVWRDGGIKGLFAEVGPRVGRAGPSVVCPPKQALNLMALEVHAPAHPRLQIRLKRDKKADSSHLKLGDSLCFLGFTWWRDIAV
ncbi:Pentatricopeptide repeat-containing protein [Drosera capensis]